MDVLNFLRPGVVHAALDEERREVVLQLDLTRLIGEKTDGLVEGSADARIDATGGFLIEPIFLKFRLPFEWSRDHDAKSTGGTITVDALAPAVTGRVESWDDAMSSIVDSLKDVVTDLASAARDYVEALRELDGLVSDEFPALEWRRPDGSRISAFAAIERGEHVFSVRGGRVWIDSSGLVTEIEATDSANAFLAELDAVIAREVEEDEEDELAALLRDPWGKVIAAISGSEALLEESGRDLKGIAIDLLADAALRGGEA